MNNDLIRRSEVVKTLENIEIGKFNRVNVIETIKSISTIERTQGKWIYHIKLDAYYCKDCGLFEPFTKEEIKKKALSCLIFVNNAVQI